MAFVLLVMVSERVIYSLIVSIYLQLRLNSHGHIIGTEYISDLVEKEHDHSVHKHGNILNFMSLLQVCTFSDELHFPQLSFPCLCLEPFARTDSHVQVGSTNMSNLY